MTVTSRENNVTISKEINIYSIHSFIKQKITHCLTWFKEWVNKTHETVVNKIGKVLALMELHMLLREEKNTRLLSYSDTCYEGRKKEWLPRQTAPSLKRWHLRWHLRWNINNKNEPAIWRSKSVTFQAKDAQSVSENESFFHFLRLIWKNTQETFKYSTLCP